MTTTKLQAIQTALSGDWQKAVVLNKQILTEDPKDIDTLNRLAYAFTSLGDLGKAKTTYKKVLGIDEQNAIALKNLKRLSSNSASDHQASQPTQMNNIFIEEPGKTKVVDLVNVADFKVTGRLRCGETVVLQAKRMKIFTTDQTKQYLGALPDDLSRRLIKFMHAGNEYAAFVKTVNNRRLSVFIRETKRVNRFKNQPSFPTGETTRLMVKGTLTKRFR